MAQLAVLLLGLQLLSAEAGAARVALLIANSRYPSAPLQNPPNDVELLADVLRNRLGFDSVTVLRDLSKTELDVALSRFWASSSRKEVAFLYFSGHGMQPSTGGKSFLLPVDANVRDDADLDGYGVSVESIVERLETTQEPARVRIVVLDACRNSPFGRLVRGTPKGLAPVRPGDMYTFVAFATCEGCVAEDGVGRYSPYAESLAAYLASADTLPIRLIFEGTADRVRQLTSQQQRPRTYGDLPSDVLLSGSRVKLTVGSSGGDSVGSPVSAANPPRPYKREADDYPAGKRFRECPECPEMAVLPEGEFDRGSPPTEEGRDSDEGPVHRVRVQKFALGRTEVTQAQWKAIMGNAPARFKACGGECPVEQVSWEDAKRYIAKLNRRVSGRDHGPYRLPTEAEWEYGCRGGEAGRHCGPGDEVDALAWFNRNGGEKTRPVAQKSANGFGLYDMSGNVWEWVEDCYKPSFDGVAQDGSAWVEQGCPRRVIRGGSTLNAASLTRAAKRDWDAPGERKSDIGFRVARTIP